MSEKSVTGEGRTSQKENSDAYETVLVDFPVDAILSEIWNIGDDPARAEAFVARLKEIAGGRTNNDLAPFVAAIFSDQGATKTRAESAAFDILRNISGMRRRIPDSVKGESRSAQHAEIDAQLGFDIAEALKRITDSAQRRKAVQSKSDQNAADGMVGQPVEGVVDGQRADAGDIGQSKDDDTVVGSALPDDPRGVVHEVRMGESTSSEIQRSSPKSFEDFTTSFESIVGLTRLAEEVQGAQEMLQEAFRLHGLKTKKAQQAWLEAQQIPITATESLRKQLVTELEKRRQNFDRLPRSASDPTLLRVWYRMVDEHKDRIRNIIDQLEKEHALDRAYAATTADENVETPEPNMHLEHDTSAQIEQSGVAKGRNENNENEKPEPYTSEEAAAARQKYSVNQGMDDSDSVVTDLDLYEDTSVRADVSTDRGPLSMSGENPDTNDGVVEGGEQSALQIETPIVLHEESRVQNEYREALRDWKQLKHEWQSARESFYGDTKKGTEGAYSSALREGKGELPKSFSDTKKVYEATRQQYVTALERVMNTRKSLREGSDHQTTMTFEREGIGKAALARFIIDEIQAERDIRMNERLSRERTWVVKKFQQFVTWQQQIMADELPNETGWQRFNRKGKRFIIPAVGGAAVSLVMTGGVSIVSQISRIAVGATLGKAAGEAAKAGVRKLYGRQIHRAQEEGVDFAKAVSKNFSAADLASNTRAFDARRKRLDILQKRRDRNSAVAGYVAAVAAGGVASGAAIETLGELAEVAGTPIERIDVADGQTAGMESLDKVDLGQVAESRPEFGNDLSGERVVLVAKGDTLGEILMGTKGNLGMSEALEAFPSNERAAALQELFDRINTHPELREVANITGGSADRIFAGQEIDLAPLEAELQAIALERGVDTSVPPSGIPQSMYPDNFSAPSEEVMTKGGDMPPVEESSRFEPLENELEPDPGEVSVVNPQVASVEVPDNLNPHRDTYEQYVPNIGTNGGAESSSLKLTPVEIPEFTSVESAAMVTENRYSTFFIEDGASKYEFVMNGEEVYKQVAELANSIDSVSWIDRLTGQHGAYDVIKNMTLEQFGQVDLNALGSMEQIDQSTLQRWEQGIKAMLEEVGGAYQTETVEDFLRRVVDGRLQAVASSTVV